MKPSNIRVATTPECHIEAVLPRSGGCYDYVTIDRQSSNVIKTNVQEDSNAFRWLVTEARKWKVK